MKFYVVRKGYKAGIYNSWEECEPQIDGFIGAEFKTFEEMPEALNWLNKRSNKIEIKVTDSIPDTSEDETVDIYTDGSYNEKTGMCGAGFVVVINEKPVYEYGFSFEDKYDARNVYGETGAVIKAIQWADQNGIKRVRINHDYIGVSKWVTGEWKRKKGVSGKYFDKFCKSTAGIYVSFRWVKGHSGNKWNSMADKLAGNAVK